MSFRNGPRWRARSFGLQVTVAIVILTAGLSVAAFALEGQHELPSRVVVESLTQSAASEADERKPIEVVPDSLSDLHHEMLEGRIIVEIAEGMNARGEDRLYILLMIPDPEIQGDWLPYTAVDIPRSGQPYAELVETPTGTSYIVFADADPSTAIEFRDSSGSLTDTMRPGEAESGVVPAGDSVNSVTVVTDKGGN